MTNCTTGDSMLVSRLKSNEAPDLIATCEAIRRTYANSPERPEKRDRDINQSGWRSHKNNVTKSASVRQSHDDLDVAPIVEGAPVLQTGPVIAQVVLASIFPWIYIAYRFGRTYARLIVQIFPDTADGGYRNFQRHHRSI